jgi:transcriptional regulator with XRE-family HTH domain
MSDKFQLIDKLEKNRVSRESYTRSKVSVSVPSQIRALRRRRKLTQQELAQEADMKQSRISAIERPGTQLNIDTLIRVAAAFKVGLIVKFAPFSEMLEWENGFSQDSFNAVEVERDWKFGRRVTTKRRRKTLKSRVSLLADGESARTQPGTQPMQMGLFTSPAVQWPNNKTTTPQNDRASAANTYVQRSTYGGV